jgi:CheY-like chemotaxis protein
MASETRHHLLFVDDDEDEVKAFRRLYEGDQFEVITVCAPFPRAAVPAVEQALGGRIPDLFVLDLFFPITNNPPGGFTGDTAAAARADVRRVLQTTEELESLFVEDTILAQSDKKLLRAASNLAYQAQQLLRHWCDILGQSPSGGIALMRLLHEKHSDVPTVFYSRKATVIDVKMALEPHESVEAREAVRIRDALRDYCEGKGPHWRSPSLGLCSAKGLTAISSATAR